MPPTSACAASSRLFGFGATAHGRRHGVVGGGQQRAEVATPQLDGRRVELAHQHVGSHGLGRGRSGGREVPAGRPEAVELLGQGWVLDGKAEAVSLAGSLRGIGNGVGAGERTQGAQPGEKVAAMCLHGTAQSGQEQDMARSWARSGKRERPQLENTSSIWRGISPARSFALYRARAARADSTRAQSASPKRPSPMLTRYGRALDPCTRALAVPAATPRSRTWPARA